MLRVVGPLPSKDPRLSDVSVGDEFMWVGWHIDQGYEYDDLMRLVDHRRFAVRREVVSSDAFEEFDMREYFPNAFGSSDSL